MRNVSLRKSGGNGKMVAKRPNGPVEQNHRDITMVVVHFYYCPCMAVEFG
jgi:hypothetical protein